MTVHVSHVHRSMIRTVLSVTRRGVLNVTPDSIWAQSLRKAFRAGLALNIFCIAKYVTRENIRASNVRDELHIIR